MKKLLFGILAVMLFSSIDVQAGFVTKKHKAAIEVVSTGKGAAGTVSAALEHKKTASEKKQTLVHKVLNILKPGSDAIPKPLYIVLAIFALGWLAMGINENFEGWNWVISLLLYILGWLPGVIYTLVMMKDYY